MLKEEGYGCLIKFNITSISVDGDLAELKTTINECSMIKSKKIE